MWKSHEKIFIFIFLKGSAYKINVMKTDHPKKIILFCIVQVKGGIYLTGLTWKDKNLGRKVEVIYMDEPCNAC